MKIFDRRRTRRTKKEKEENIWLAEIGRIKEEEEEKFG